MAIEDRPLIHPYPETSLPNLDAYEQFNTSPAYITLEAIADLLEQRTTSEENPELHRAHEVVERVIDEPAPLGFIGAWQIQDKGWDRLYKDPEYQKARKAWIESGDRGYAEHREAKRRLKLVGLSVIIEIAAGVYTDPQRNDPGSEQVSQDSHSHADEHSAPGNRPPRRNWLSRGKKNTF